MNNKKNLKIGILLVIFLLIIAGGIYIYHSSQADTAQGTKEITVEVIMADESSNSYNIKTDEEYLRGALEQENLIDGSDSEQGLFVTTVDGYTVDDSKQEWWSFSQDGESLMTGVDTTVINDGDKFEIRLMVGY